MVSLLTRSASAFIYLRDIKEKSQTRQLSFFISSLGFCSKVSQKCKRMYPKMSSKILSSFSDCKRLDAQV